MNLDTLNLFPTYVSQAAYKLATGKDAPWDLTKEIKFWADPNAATSGKRSIVYQNSFQVDEKGGYIIDPATEAPLIDVAVFTAIEAASYNIPPGDANTPGATGVPVPCPIRALKSTEKLIKGFMGIWQVVDSTTVDAPAVAYSTYDRGLLERLITKLGA